MSLITKQGMINLKEKLISLEQEEKEALNALIVARGFGDFSENAELEAARNWLDRINNDQQKTKAIISQAVVFNVNNIINENVVGFGACVMVEDENDKIFEYKIVNETESNLKEGKISSTSPIAKALFSKKIDDECVFSAPSGQKSYLIKKIDYSWLK